MNQPPQEFCLFSEPGAGAAYMSSFDRLHPVVRGALREAKTNICIACLSNIVGMLCGDPYDPQITLQVISNIDEGKPYDYGTRTRSQNEYPSRRGIQDLYVSPNYPTDSFYDPRRDYPGSFEYSAERELRIRMEQWQRELSRPVSLLDFDWASPKEPTLNPIRTTQEFFIEAKQAPRSIKGKR
jgi:hypothetical protein